MKVIKTEGKFSYEIEAPEKREIGGVKRMKVIDVRDGEKHRAKVNAILKEQRANAGSKFMKPSFSLWGYSYNQSHKK